jgi:two-component system catabolic regulation response regulator CreB
MPLLLLVEDEPPIAETVAYALREDGFDVRHCLTAGAALAAAKGDRFDLAILDVGLPDLGGFALCRELRREADLPVIFLTAHAAEAERVLGFDLGADDYVTKPFSPRELVARVRAVLRRAQGGPAAGTQGTLRTARLRTARSNTTPTATASAIAANGSTSRATNTACSPPCCSAPARCCRAHN